MELLCSEKGWSDMIMENFSKSDGWLNILVDHVVHCEKLVETSIVILRRDNHIKSRRSSLCLFCGIQKYPVVPYQSSKIILVTYRSPPDT